MPTRLLDDPNTAEAVFRIKIADGGDLHSGKFEQGPEQGRAPSPQSDHPNTDACHLDGALAHSPL
jgi:hypothetical protein